jgi:rRNA maturation endonuclease Nob1
MKCTRCQTEIEANFKFCPSCGEAVNKIDTCSSCRNQVKPEWVSCPFCGSALKEQAPMPNPRHQTQYNPASQPRQYEHGYSHGSGSSKRRHKRGFLGRLFSS